MADDWDASAIAAVAALIIALFALLVAVAQALQQHLITGQLIRLCDSVVFGPLPGQGYRVWQFSQFRFRVLYSIPQINLEADLWPKESPHIRSYAVGEEMLPNLQPDSLVDYSSSSSSIEIVHNYRVKLGVPQIAPITLIDNCWAFGYTTNSKEYAQSYHRRAVTLGVPQLVLATLIGTSWASGCAASLRESDRWQKRNSQPLAPMTHPWARLPGCPSAKPSTGHVDGQ
ncbi:hypothetical protein RAB80_015065 [Fusarium oxysporum f. sp. vasinfectum]|uniref:Uncharacterized protein n=1 Tax=Fusarium oxysporum f. sp. vasinfectum 25433 TaxID=1089449 RepID=X0KZV7_FUSOX|nr:hypothetical protein FOTG_12917 [Fusarium oxysporum f. sp. vasinfectum 25433]KAK2669539.1 hypothetical protein RAB80_015065 [Fusarium oxysporum f. sp. vasinfectum]KAK2925098.1 hypothetical protein FoTM2_015377 [Fusarium oxysporum f. sp. vasinfectum]